MKYFMYITSSALITIIIVINIINVNQIVTCIFLMFNMKSPRTLKEDYLGLQRKIGFLKGGILNVYQ